MSELYPENIHRALVASEYQAVGRGIPAVLVDRRILDEQMCVTDIDSAVRRQAVLASEGKPRAILIREPWSAVRVVDRRLVDGSARLERPSVAIAIGHAQA